MELFETIPRESLSEEVFVDEKISIEALIYKQINKVVCVCVCVTCYTILMTISLKEK